MTVRREIGGSFQSRFLSLSEILVYDMKFLNFGFQKRLLVLEPINSQLNVKIQNVVHEWQLYAIRQYKKCSVVTVKLALASVCGIFSPFQTIEIYMT